VLLAVRVRVLVVVVVLGLNEAVTRFGKPDAESVTEPVKPFSCAMEIVDAPRPPRATLRLAGKAERLKFGPGVTVSETVVELTSEPEVPVTVI